MRITGGGARFTVPVSAAIWWAARFAAAADPAVDTAMAAEVAVEVEQVDGSVASGRLVGIDAAEVRLAGGVEPAVVLPVERVREVRRRGRDADGGRRIVLTLVDGSTLSGDEFTWDGKQPAVLVRPEGRVVMPAARIRSVAVRREAAAGTGAAPWQAAIPDGTSSDLIVVGGEDGHEFVECAITAVSADTVTVILDDETIPVKRSKVIGMQWLRGDAGAAGSPGRLAVAVAGGGLRGDRVEWSADGLVVDGEIRLPASMLAGVDYASGRTMGLAGMVAEKVSVEPWFGSLGRGSGLETFFAPRTVPSRPAGGRQDESTATKAAIVMRPRTVATWRLPPDGRRFRARVVAAAGPQAADAAVVVVAVDDRELFRRQVDAAASTAADGGSESAAGIPVDIDLTGGRRLTVTVDFASAGGIGAAVVFSDPVIER